MIQQADRTPLEAPSGICALPYAERFTVWASRVWIECFRADNPTCPRLENMFHHAKLSDHLGPFYAFFTLVAHGAQRKLDFRCPGCKNVGEDERLLLIILAAQQWGSPTTADSILNDWLHRTAARRAAYPARMFAHGLAEAGFILGCRFSPLGMPDNTEPLLLH